MIFIERCRESGGMDFVRDEEQLFRNGKSRTLVITGLINKWGQSPAWQHGIPGSCEKKYL
jgi:hypothetical protein